jgi:DNA mismatch endonuclease (patch repair protein)
MPDNLSPENRRKTMQAVKGRDTSIERAVGSALHTRGLRYRRCVTALPGKPDFVFTGVKLVVFVDGSFWHGWRFSTWKANLQPYWREKIERTRFRDQRNFKKLRRQGWKVMRFWDHQIKRDLAGIADLIEAEVRSRRQVAVP